MNREQFKKLISILETNSNPEAEHELMTTGSHKGTRAMGEYGLMPKTAQDLARRNPNQTELDRLIMKADPTTVQEILESNPEKMQEYVNMMSDKVLDKAEGNAREASLRWLAGPNASDTKLQKTANEFKSRLDRADDFVKSTQQVQPTLVEQLQQIAPKEEVLFNKLRNNMRKP